MNVEGRRLTSVLGTASGAIACLLGRFRLVLGSTSSDGGGGGGDGGAGDEDVVEVCWVVPTDPLALRLRPDRRRRGTASLDEAVVTGVDLGCRAMGLDVVERAGTPSSAGSFARLLPLSSPLVPLSVPLATSASATWLLRDRDGPEAFVRARLVGRVDVVGRVGERGTVGADSSAVRGDERRLVVVVVVLGGRGGCGGDSGVTEG